MHPKAQLLRPTERDLGPHLLTAQVDKLHEKRLKFAAIITNQMRVAEKADFADKQHLVKLAKPIVYGYLNYLRQNDKEAIKSGIAGFFLELKLHPEVKEALYELGFKTYLDELEAADEGYENTRTLRNAQISQRPKGSTLPVQRELQYILNILFEQVDYYQHVYKDIDYTGLLTALNHTIAIYTKLIKTRDTQRKNKKLKALESTDITVEEKPEMDKKQPNNVAVSTEAKTTKDATEKQKKTPSAIKEKKKENKKPGNGLLDILSKLEKGSKEKYKDNDKGEVKSKNLPPTSGG